MSRRLESYMVSVVSWLFIRSSAAGVREALTSADTQNHPHALFHTRGIRASKLLNHLGSTKSNLWFIMHDRGLNS